MFTNTEVIGDLFAHCVINCCFSYSAIVAEVCLCCVCVHVCVLGVDKVEAGEAGEDA